MELNTNPLNILIVDKDQNLVCHLKKIFSTISFPIKNIFHEENATKAIVFLRRQTVDIIFLDLDNATKNGIKAYTKIQPHIHTTPLVILIPIKDIRFALEAINNGADDFLIKEEIKEKILKKAILYNIERKRIEESLMLSNERYKLISKATNDMVWDWDLQNNKVYRSKAGWERLFGDETDDSNLSDSWWERVHPADRKRIDGLLEQILSNKEVEHFEIPCRVIKNDGTFAYVIDRGYAMRNEAGEAIRLIGVTQNITRQKEAEEKVRANEQRFRSIIEKSKEGLMMLNLKGQIIEMSATGKEILGLIGDVDIDTLREKLVRPSDTKKGENVFEQVLKKYGLVKLTEYQFRRPDGEIIWLEVTLHNLLNDPAVQAVVIHFRDITSRKTFEQGLKVSEEKYRSLFNVNPSAIIISNPIDFSIIEVNEASIKEFGYSKKEFLKLKTIDLVVNETNVKELSEKKPAGAGYQSENLWTVITAKGEIKYMNGTSRSINYYGQNATLTIANNISEKVALEKKLAEERLKKQHEITAAVITAQEQERELLGKELHDNINQILVTTKLYIEYAMANDELKESLLENAKGFVTSAVNELRNLSKSLLPPSLGEVGLVMALNELVESIQVLNQFKLQTDWNDLDESKLSDKLKLTIFRIIQEQLSNIIKHAFAKNVFIKIKIKNQRLSINVKDDGIGFNTKAKSKGVGLKNITSRAELHNGKMKLTSEKQKGCILDVKFDL